jgi:hypothetical protein
MSAAIAAIGISAGVAAYSAHKAASASKEASNAQVASAGNALDLQKGIYGEQTANLAPYRAAGEASLARLNNFQTFNGVPGRLGAGVNPQPSDPTRSQRTPGEIANGQQFKANMPMASSTPMASLAQPQGPAMQPPPNQGPMATQPMPSSQMPSGAPQMAPGAVPAPGQATAATAATAATGGERMVMMKSPTGETGQVPESQVQHFVQKGATVVQ